MCYPTVGRWPVMSMHILVGAESRSPCDRCEQWVVTVVNNGLFVTYVESCMFDVCSSCYELARSFFGGFLHRTSVITHKMSVSSKYIWLFGHIRR